ncbi:Pol4p [Rhizophagus irregularis DAOM 197198w]|nr:Pol4p [Rhizophagus irregularis DAOM 197198w]
MSQESKKDNSTFNRHDEISFRDEDYNMERERVSSSLNSTFLGEMESLDILSSQEVNPFTMLDNVDDEDDPKEELAKQKPSKAENDVKSSDAAPRAVGAGLPSKVSSFSVLSKSINDRKKAVYEFVVPNNNVKSGDVTKKQQKSRKIIKNPTINTSKSKLLPNLSQLKTVQQQSQLEDLPKPKRGRKKKNIVNDDDTNLLELFNNSSKPEEGLFSKLRILFIPNKIDKVRLSLMKSKVLDKGGIIEESIETAKNVTHVITELNGNQLVSMFGIRKLKNFKDAAIIKPDWISESIMLGKLRDTKSYAVLYTEESNDTNIASSSQTQNLKRPHDEQKAEKQETNLENHETPDKKRRIYSPKPLSSDIIQECVSSLESNINNDTSFTDSTNNDTTCNVMSDDPLSEMIAETKRLVEAGLYVDDEGDDDESTQSNNTTTDLNEEIENLNEEVVTDSNNSETNSGETNEQTNNSTETKTSSFKAKNFRGQNSFACMHSHSYGETNNNPNKLIIEKLQVLLDHYTRMKDEWRILSYRKAISAIKKYKKPITSYEEAKKIPGIGLRTAEKIAEIIDTGNLKRIDSFSEGDDIIKKFGNVYGVGPSIAMKWYVKGYRTFEDVLKDEKLTRNQISGILYYDDLQKRIPRDEVTKISEWVTRAALSIDPKLECITGGSYRRGNPDCGDVDIMITRNDSDGTTHLGVLSRLVEILRDQGFLTHELVQHNGESLSAKFMGICKLPEGVHRRLDIFMVPYNEMGAALLSYTGNDIFNRSMRLMARKKKMCLNQHGLFMNVSRGRDGIKYSEGKIIAQKTEKEICDALGVPWR